MSRRDPTSAMDVLAHLTPVVLTDRVSGVCGVLLAKTTLAPKELLERLYDRAEAWLATCAGAPVRAYALETAPWGTPAGELRLALLEVVSSMAPTGDVDLSPDVVAARLLLDPARFTTLRLDEEEGGTRLVLRRRHGRAMSVGQRVADSPQRCGA